ncbi:MAG: hypothetical protein AAF197_03110 [Pseudomonadota bacterium]
MDTYDYLHTTAEIGAALAGFSALIVAISTRGDSSPDMMFRRLVATIVERGLLSVFFSLLPFLLLGFEIADDFVWRICSGIFVIYAIALTVRSFVAYRMFPQLSGLLGKGVFLLTMILALIVICLQCANVLGFGASQSAWWYVIGLTWLLLTASYMFFLSVRYWAREI